MKIVDCKDLALKGVSISGDIIGKYGIFEIEQTFINNTKEILEVNYTFPIIDTATVIGFTATIGDKNIRGICKEKNEAIKEYHENIVKGNSAYMLNQDADNIFNVSLGKIDINEEVKVKISYIDFLPIVDNEIKVLIPTLVTPRYNCEITSVLEYEMVDYKVNYSVDFKLNIDKSINVSNIESTTHNIKICENGNYIKVEALKYEMNKDFILNIKLKQEANSNAIFSKTKNGEEIICLSFMPEINNKFEDSEKEYIFIVDISGSMQGNKIEETKKAVKECLKQLDVGDKFNIIPFESNYTAFNIESIEFNEENVMKAEKYIDSLIANGGTEILKPIKFALYEPSDDKVILLFTDGQVGNEEQILNYVSENIKESKLFAFGIDSNINTSFIRNISKLGNGKSEFIHPGEKIDDKVIRTFARIQSPLIEELTINYGKNKVLDEVKEENRLFNYEYFNVYAKIETLQDDIILKAKSANEVYEWKISKDDMKNTHIDLEKVFAKLQIDRLQEYINITPYNKQDTYKQMIIDISTKYSIATEYTTFISVYERENKLINVPKYQNIVLNNSNPVQTMAINSMYDLDIPMFLRKNKKASSKPFNLFRLSEECDIEYNELDESKYIKKLKEYFKENNINQITTYILFAIYFYKNNENIIGEGKLMSFLEENIDKIINSEENMELVYLLYLNSNDNIKKYIYNNIFTKKYKKIVDTGVNYIITFNIERLPNNQILKNIKTKIDNVLWSLISLNIKTY